MSVAFPQYTSLIYGSPLGLYGSNANTHVAIPQQIKDICRLNHPLDRKIHHEIILNFFTWLTNLDEGYVRTLAESLKYSSSLIPLLDETLIHVFVPHFKECFRSCFELHKEYTSPEQNTLDTAKITPEQLNTLSDVQELIQRRSKELKYLNILCLHCNDLYAKEAIFTLSLLINNELTDTCQRTRLLWLQRIFAGSPSPDYLSLLCDNDPCILVGSIGINAFEDFNALLSDKSLLTTVTGKNWKEEDDPPFRVLFTGNQIANDIVKYQQIRPGIEPCTLKEVKKELSQEKKHFSTKLISFFHEMNISFGVLKNLKLDLYYTALEVRRDTGSMHDQILEISPEFAVDETLTKSRIAEYEKVTNKKIDKDKEKELEVVCNLRRLYEENIFNRPLLLAYMIRFFNSKQEPNTSPHSVTLPNFTLEPPSLFNRIKATWNSCFN